jgi:hypothetical protein
MHSSTITLAAPLADGETRHPGEHRHRRSAPDQTNRAQDIISTWLALNPSTQDGLLARLIAATVHGGPNTALERFAANGDLDAEAALAELNDVVVPIEREPWLDALGRYIIAGGGHA